MADEPRLITAEERPALFANIQDQTDCPYLKCDFGVDGHVLTQEAYTIPASYMQRHREDYVAYMIPLMLIQCPHLHEHLPVLKAELKHTALVNNTPWLVCAKCFEAFKEFLHAKETSL